MRGRAAVANRSIRKTMNVSTHTDSARNTTPYKQNTQHRAFCNNLAPSPCCGFPAGYPAAVKKEGELIVDLRGRQIETRKDFWDAVAKPCRPEWFGRNLDAWSDTIHA